MSNEEAFEIVARSHEVHLEWRLKSLEERAEVIAAIGTGLRDRRKNSRN